MRREKEEERNYTKTGKKGSRLYIHTISFGVQAYLQQPYNRKQTFFLFGAFSQNLM